jgi:hypothetical protein
MLRPHPGLPGLPARTPCDICRHTEFVNGDFESRQCFYSECDCIGFTPNRADAPTRPGGRASEPEAGDHDCSTCSYAWFRRIHVCRPEASGRWDSLHHAPNLASAPSHEIESGWDFERCRWGVGSDSPPRGIACPQTGPGPMEDQQEERCCKLLRTVYVCCGIGASNSSQDRQRRRPPFARP